AIRRKKRPVRVEVTGVGFFDALRKHGSSYNGFELHPVVSLFEIAPEAPPPQFAAEEGPTGGDDATLDEENGDADASEDPAGAEASPGRAGPLVRSRRAAVRSGPWDRARPAPSKFERVVAQRLRHRRPRHSMTLAESAEFPGAGGHAKSLPADFLQR